MSNGNGWYIDGPDPKTRSDAPFRPGSLEECNVAGSPAANERPEQVSFILFKAFF